MIYILILFAYLVVGSVISGVMKAHDDTYKPSDDGFYYVGVPLIWPIMAPLFVLSFITNAVANLIKKEDK